MRCDVDPDEVSARARSSPLTFRRDSVTQSIRIGFSVHRTQRPRGALDDLFRDHDFLYAFEARQVEHRVEQDTFYDRAQSARPGPAVDGLAGNGAKRLLRQREIDRLHLEQPLVLFHSAFLGWVRMSLREGSSRSSSVATTGSRPTNSGIRPYFKRSSGSTSRKISPALRSSGARTLALKPIEAERPRAEMIFSSPLKAPPHTNRMLVVSTCRNSCCGCLRPPCGGTDAIVPSMILSKACCTPSPETSRVMDGLSDLREILSISSM